jgi:hypothetical protein
MLSLHLSKKFQLKILISDPCLRCQGLLIWYIDIFISVMCMGAWRLGGLGAWGLGGLWLGTWWMRGGIKVDPWE